MKQFIVDRHTTPGTAALEAVGIPKVPVYDTIADAEADLSNLTVGQLIATKDTGVELAQPVDVLEKNNLHAVTSNAVAVALARKNLFSGSVTGTATQYTLNGKISDYKWVVISGLDTNVKVRGTVVLPATSLQNGFNIACYWNNGITGLFGTYVDDTHLNLSTADAAKIKYCTIHGIFS